MAYHRDKRCNYPLICNDVWKIRGIVELVGSKFSIKYDCNQYCIIFSKEHWFTGDILPSPNRRFLNKEKIILIKKSNFLCHIKDYFFFLLLSLKITLLLKSDGWETKKVPTHHFHFQQSWPRDLCLHNHLHQSFQATIYTVFDFINRKLRAKILSSKLNINVQLFRLL